MPISAWASFGMNPASIAITKRKSFWMRAARMSFSARKSSFFYSIRHVVVVRPQKQMSWIKTNFIVTMMAHKKPLWNFSVCLYPHNPMHRPHTMFTVFRNPNCSIAATICRSLPFPASSLIDNLDFFVIRSKIVMLSLLLRLYRASGDSRHAGAFSFVPSNRTQNKTSHRRHSLRSGKPNVIAGAV